MASRREKGGMACLFSFMVEIHWSRGACSRAVTFNLLSVWLWAGCWASGAEPWTANSNRQVAEGRAELSARKRSIAAAQVSAVGKLCAASTSLMASGKYRCTDVEFLG
ncbi:hypothetical protein SRHO_G00039330 [Serrasalmus rhombeus]